MYYLFNTFLLTKLFHICSVIISMSAVFYNVENNRNKEKNTEGQCVSKIAVVWFNSNFIAAIMVQMVMIHNCLKS